MSRAAVAAPSLTVDDAVREGRAHSPRVQKAEAAAIEGEWKQTEARAGFLPRVSASASRLLSKKFQVNDVNVGAGPLEVPLILPTTSVGLEAQWPIFDGLQNVNRYAAADLQKQAAREEADWAGFQTEQDVRLRFFQALAAVELERVTGQNLKTLRDHLERVRLLKRAGTSTNYDVLRVEVQLHEAESESMNAADSVALARGRLNEAMGLGEDDRALEGALPAPGASGTVKTLTFERADARVDLTALDHRVESARRNQSANAAWWSPRISLGGQYLVYNNRDSSWFDSDRFRSAYNVGVYLSWTLFDGGVSWARSGEAAAQRAQAEKGALQARLHAPNDFDLWKRRYLYSATLFEAKRADVEKAREAVRLATEGFRQGVRTTSEVLDAELELFRAQAGVVNSQMNAAEAQINLELALGRRI